MQRRKNCNAHTGLQLEIQEKQININQYDSKFTSNEAVEANDPYELEMKWNEMKSAMI